MMDHVYDVWMGMTSERHDFTKEEFLDIIAEEVVEATSTWMKIGVFSFMRSKFEGIEEQESEEE